MNKPRWTARALVMLLAACAARALSAGEPVETELAIAPEVLAAMGELTEVSRAHPIVRLTQRLPPGGPMGGTETTHEFTSLGRNLYGAHLSATFGTQHVEGTTLTLCGLVDLLSAAQPPASERTVVIPAPIGSLFVPLGIRMRMEFSSSASVTRLALSAPAAQLCQPTPGMAFSYEFDSLSRMRSKSGWAKTASSLAVTSRSECSVGQPRPVGGMLEGAAGDYLPVVCETTVTVGKSRKANALRRELAYLPEAGFYVLVSGQESTKIQLQD